MKITTNLNFAAIAPLALLIYSKSCTNSLLSDLNLDFSFIVVEDDTLENSSSPEGRPSISETIDRVFKCNLESPAIK